MSPALSTALTYLGAGLLTAGSLMTLIAAIGVARFPSLLQRQHAATKPQLVGFILTILGVVAIMQTPAWAAAGALAIILQTVTAPVGAHLIGRAARKGGRITDVPAAPTYLYITARPGDTPKNPETA